MSGKLSVPSSKFPKSKHLLKRADFRRVYETGRRQFTGNMTVFFLRRNAGQAPEPNSGMRVGFTVGKVLGGSVERNRIRRRMREALRLSWPSRQAEAPIDVIFNPRKSVLTLAFGELAGEVDRAIKLAAQRARVAQSAVAKGNTGTVAK